MPNLKKSINQAHLENRTYEQIVTHLERELDLNGLEAPDELQVNTLSQQPTNNIAHRPKPTCQHCKKSGLYRNQFRLLKKQREQNKLKKTKVFLETKTVTTITLTQTATSTITTTTKTVTEPRESRKLFTHPVRHLERQSIHKEMLFWSQCSQSTALPAQKTWKTESGPTESQSKRL